MNSQEGNQPLANVEADFIGVLFAFHKKTMTLLRESSLDDEKMKVVAARLKTLLDEAIAEMKTTKQANVAERLDAAYAEAKRMVDELGQVQENKQTKPRSRRKNKP